MQQLVVDGGTLFCILGNTSINSKSIELTPLVRGIAESSHFVLVQLEPTA